jgi:nitrite reductase/ring-hydroxylating ferredoxin subunit
MASLRAMLHDELGYDLGSLLARVDDVEGDGDGEASIAPPPRAEVAEVASRLGRGEVAPAQAAGHDVAVARLASGRLVVVHDACPHDGGRISDGYVEGEHLVCARHGWELDVAAGPAGPCDGPCPAGPALLRRHKPPANG